MKDITELYSEDFRKIMKVNDKYTSMCSNRVEEIMNFARGSGFSRIGIAHCITFTREAKLLQKYFSESFEVYTVDCKYGNLTKREIFGGGNYTSCNPAGQADYLNKKNTDLNISMGLCVGHDMIFSKKSEAWVTNLFDKDFTNNNNPARAVSETAERFLKKL